MTEPMFVEAYPVAEGRCPHCGHGLSAFWTPARMIEAIQSFASHHGRPPKASEFRKGSAHTPEAAAVAKMFGRWNVAIAAAGFEPRVHGGVRQTRWGEEAVFDAFYRWREQYGQLPRERDWRRSGDEWPNSMTVKRLFGSWNGALLAAGYEPPKRDSRGPAPGLGRHAKRRREHARLRTPVAAEPITQAVRGYIGEGGSVVAVAELVGLDESQLRRLLRGSHRNVNLDLADRILTAIGREDVLVGLDVAA